MNITTRRVAALVGALTLSLGAAACSTSEPTSDSTSKGVSTSAATTTKEAAPKATTVVEKAKANALAATSGAFTGEITEKGETMKIAFKGTKDGSTSDITIDMSPKGKVRLVSVGGSVYMQADATFWKSQGAPAEVQKAGDKFIKAPAGESAMAQDLTISSFLKEAFAELTPDKISDTVGEETVNGVDCWVVTDKKGAQEGSLYVSKDAYELVRFTGSSDSPGQIDFTSWNEDLGVTAPAKDQILDIG